MARFVMHHINQQEAYIFDGALRHRRRDRRNTKKPNTDGEKREIVTVRSGPWPVEAKSAVPCAARRANRDPAQTAATELLRAHGDGGLAA
jgi:hypothetical protein